MNIQEKAEQYAREKLGNWCHIVHSAYEISQCTNGEVSTQDYTAGYNEAKRWIPVGERLPVNHRNGKSKEILCKYRDIKFFGYYDLDEKQFGKFGSNRFYSVDEWREI